MVNWVLTFILLPYGVLMLILLVTVYLLVTWNIPITVFRYTGDRRRPMIIHTKGRKFERHGVTELKVRGYKHSIRDFKSENYYPSPKKKFGGLALFEFEDGQLTPVIPSFKSLKGHPEFEKALAVIRDFAGSADFRFDDRVYHQLRLNMVDDTDKDFEVQNLARQHVQYRTAFDKFMAVLPFGIIAFVMMILLIGFILWLKEDPENAARACVRTVEPFLQRAVDAVRPPG